MIYHFSNCYYLAGGGCDCTGKFIKREDVMTEEEFRKNGPHHPKCTLSDMEPCNCVFLKGTPAEPGSEKALYEDRMSKADCEAFYKHNAKVFNDAITSEDGGYKNHLGEICNKAKTIVTNRHKIYGSPKQNFENIAAFWNVRFADKLELNQEFTAADVAVAMRLVKEARLMETPAHKDSLVDIAGYADCQNEINQHDAEEEVPAAEFIKNVDVLLDAARKVNDASEKNYSNTSTSKYISENCYKLLEKGDVVTLINIPARYVLFNKAWGGEYWIARSLADGNMLNITRLNISDVIRPNNGENND